MNKEESTWLGDVEDAIVSADDKLQAIKFNDKKNIKFYYQRMGQLVHIHELETYQVKEPLAIPYNLRQVSYITKEGLSDSAVNMETVNDLYNMAWDLYRYLADTNDHDTDYAKTFTNALLKSIADKELKFWTTDLTSVEDSEMFGYRFSKTNVF